MGRLLLTLAITCFTTAATANCGGKFDQFVTGLRQDARTLGYRSTLVNSFFDQVSQDPKVLRADRSQGVFQKDFIAFSNALISQNRLTHAAKNAEKYALAFQKVEQRFGIPSGVLLAFWAFETDFGANQGNFNTLNSLVTLAHDCRRPELFHPQIFAALELFKRGGFDPALTQGAWAGEIGMIQMLPKDILESGTDGDGDRQVDLQNSAPDALMSGGHMLNRLGWQANAPWLQEIELPANLDWSMTGLDKAYSVARWKSLGIAARDGALHDKVGEASVLLPVGHNGPAFLAYPNFNVYFEWNQSLVYVTTAAYFATLLAGEPAYDARIPDQGLDGTQMKDLQRKLVGRGHDVGKVDGILGSKTRAAVQAEQSRLGLPSDAWPTPELLNRL
jgi:lytic murein transglycosylase